MWSFYKKNNSFYQLATCRDLKGFRDGNGTKSSRQIVDNHIPTSNQNWICTRFRLRMRIKFLKV